jgi:hypothetical protein
MRAKELLQVAPSLSRGEKNLDTVHSLTELNHHQVTF